MELLLKWIHNETAARFALLAFTTLVILGLVRLFQPYLVRGIKEASTRYRTRRFANLVGYFAVVIAAISIFSDQLGVFGVVLGVAGAGAAFALQDLVAGVAGWFVIAFGRFYKVGDRVQLGGIRGDVIEVGILRTTIMEAGDWDKGGLYTGAIVRVPNSASFKTPAHNYSAEFPYLWDEITIPVRYGSDYPFVRKMLRQIASEATTDDAASAQTEWRRLAVKYPVGSSSADPSVTMAPAKESVEFTIRYITDYRTRRAQRDRLFTRILEEVARNPERVALAVGGLATSAPGTSADPRNPPS